MTTLPFGHGKTEEELRQIEAEKVSAPPLTMEQQVDKTVVLFEKCVADFVSVMKIYAQRITDWVVATGAYTGRPPKLDGTMTYHILIEENMKHEQYLQERREAIEATSSAQIVAFSAASKALARVFSLPLPENTQAVIPTSVGKLWFEKDRLNPNDFGNVGVGGDWGFYGDVKKKHQRQLAANTPTTNKLYLQKSPSDGKWILTPDSEIELIKLISVYGMDFDVKCFTNLKDPQEKECYIELPNAVWNRTVTFYKKQ